MKEFWSTKLIYDGPSSTKRGIKKTKRNENMMTILKITKIPLIFTLNSPII